MIRADEVYRVGKGGALSSRKRGVYYRCQVPLTRDLDVLVATTDYTVAIHAGGDCGQGLWLVPVQPVKAELVPKAKAHVDSGLWPSTTPVLWWDRSIDVTTAQQFEPEAVTNGPEPKSPRRPPRVGRARGQSDVEASPATVL